jgi:magnesium-transporting ATPase (P-type)
MSNDSETVDKNYKRDVDRLTKEMYRVMALARSLLTHWANDTRASPEGRETAEKALADFSETDKRLSHPERLQEGWTS